MSRVGDAIKNLKNQAKRDVLYQELAALSPILNDAEKKADYEKWMPGGDYRTAIQVVGTLAAVHGGDRHSGRLHGHGRRLCFPATGWWWVSMWVGSFKNLKT
jgi:hypothetical protein